MPQTQCFGEDTRIVESAQGRFTNGTEIIIGRAEICSNREYIPICQNELGVNASVGICARARGYYGELALRRVIMLHHIQCCVI